MQLKRSWKMSGREEPWKLLGEASSSFSIGTCELKLLPAGQWGAAKRRDIFVLDLWLLFQERVPLCPSEFLMLHFCPFIEIYSSPLTAAPSHPVNCFLINEAVFSSSDPWTHVLRSQDWLQHRHRFIHLVFKSHLVCLFSLIRRIELVILLLSRAPVWNLRKLSP